MKRLITLTAIACLAAPLAAADPVVAQPETAISEFQLPSKDEIKALQEELPAIANQMSEVMGTLMGAMQDEGVKDGMGQSLGALKNHMEDMDLDARDENGLPDIAMLMGSMLELMADDEFRDGLEAAIVPLQDIAESLASEETVNWQ